MKIEDKILKLWHLSYRPRTSTSTYCMFYSKLDHQSQGRGNLHIKRKGTVGFLQRLKFLAVERGECQELSDFPNHENTRQKKAVTETISLRAASQTSSLLTVHI